MTYIQTNVIDSYNNLPIKTIVGLKWANLYCADAKFILKADHDTFVSVAKLVCILSTIPKERQQLLYTGRIRNNTQPMRPGPRPYKKYYKIPDYLYKKLAVTYNEYPGDVFPDYCAGEGFVLSNAAAKRIVQQAPFSRFIHLEDVFIGVCAKDCGIKASYTKKLSAERDDYNPKYHILSHPFTYQERIALWKNYTEVSGDISC